MCVCVWMCLCVCAHVYFVYKRYENVREDPTENEWPFIMAAEARDALID